MPLQCTRWQHPHGSLLVSIQSKTLWRRSSLILKKLKSQYKNLKKKNTPQIIIKVLHTPTLLCTFHCITFACSTTPCCQLIHARRNRAVHQSVWSDQRKHTYCTADLGSISFIKHALSSAHQRGCGLCIWFNLGLAWCLHQRANLSHVESNTAVCKD